MGVFIIFLIGHPDQVPGEGFPDGGHSGFRLIMFLALVGNTDIPLYGNACIISIAEKS